MPQICRAIILGKNGLSKELMTRSKSSLTKGTAPVKAGSAVKMHILAQSQIVRTHIAGLADHGVH